MADLENQVPAGDATVFRIASLTKPITATAAMQLAERGKLDLDAPVQRYVPEFPAKQWPLTVRHLLAHSGGVRNYRGTEETITRHYSRLADALSIFGGDPLEFEPGTKVSYSTWGYVLLGCAIEAASGMTYAEYVKHNIFERAGMDRTFVDDPGAIVPGRARGYVLRDGEVRNCAFADSSHKISAGGFVASAGDMARFAVALLAGKLVSQADLDAMWSPYRLSGGKESPGGLGWGVFVRNGVREVGHSGQQQGATSYLLVRRDKGNAIVVLTNLENPDGIDLLAARVLAAVAR